MPLSPPDALHPERLTPHRRWRTASLVLAAALMSVAGVLSLRSLQRGAAQEAWVRHTNGVLQTFDAMEGGVAAAEAAQRGYLLTGGDVYLARGHAAAAGARRALDRARRLTADNPAQQRRLAEVEPLLRQRLHLLAAIEERARRGDRAGAVDDVRIGAGDAIARQVTERLREAENVERALLATRMARATVATARARWSLALAAAGAMLAVALGGWLLRDEGRRTRHALAALRDAHRRLGALVDTQQAIATAGVDVDRVLDVVVRRAAALTGVDASVVEMVDGDELLYRAATGAMAAHVGLRLPIGTSLSGRCVRDDVALRCDDSETDPRVARDACRRLGVRSMVVVPLRHDGRVVGALKVSSPVPNAFADGDAAALALLAGLAAAAIDTADAFAARSAAEARARGAIDASLDAVFVYRAERDAAGALADFEIVHCNARAGALVAIPADDLLGHRLTQLFPLARDGGAFAVFERVLATGEPQVVDYEARDPRTVARWVRLQIVRVDDGLAVTARDISDEKARAASLREAAERDELTGLLNRRGFLAAGEREWARAGREGRAVVAAYLDLNAFKAINDTHGHAEGDRALRTMADVLRHAVRGADVVARLGGDEFAVLVVPGGPDGASADPDEVAARLADRIRTQLARSNAGARARGRAYDVRTAIGLAVAAIDVADAPESLEALVALADAALYAEKRALRAAAGAAA